MTDRERDRPAGGSAPSAASESAKVHGDKLEELIPREPRETHEGASGDARLPADVESEADEPRGHS